MSNRANEQSEGRANLLVSCGGSDCLQWYLKPMTFHRNSLIRLGWTHGQNLPPSLDVNRDHQPLRSTGS